LSLLSTKPISRILRESEGGEHQLKRTLGPVNLVALGIGAVIGAGLFALTPTAAHDNAGPAVIFSFIIAGIGCAFAGMCYSEFSTMIPIAGSAYTYAYATMGELLAWIIGWDLVLEYAVGAATVASGWSGYLGILLRGLGINLPQAWTHAPLAQPAGIMNLPALLIVLFITYVLYIGISESARLNSIIVGIKLFVIGAVIVVGAFYVKPSNWSPFAPMGWSGVMRGAGVIFFAYIGFDAVSTAAEEVVDPNRDLPLGILGSLFVCTLLYILVAGVLTGMVPAKGIDITAPLASAFLQRGMHAISGLISLGAVAGLTSVLLVLMLGQSRVFFAVSRDGLLPPAFSRIHPKYRTPYIPTTLTGIAVGLAAAFLPIDELGEMTSIGTLFAFVLVCIGVWILRHSEPQLKRPFRTPLVPLVPILGAFFCLYLLASLREATWIRLIVWLVIGLVIYFSYGRFHSKVQSHIVDKAAASGR